MASTMKVLAPAPIVTRTRVTPRASVVSRSTSAASSLIASMGSSTVQGTVRLRNEDRFDIQISDAPPADGSISAFAAVYDGHGGFLTAEWLRQNFFRILSGEWKNGETPERCMTRGYLNGDQELLAPRGFMGMGERGVGGSKCGSTSATVIIWQGQDGKRYLVAANVGDARVLLSRGGKVEQLTVDHVPDDEDERLRIEAQNPNPKQPLVRYVGDTWRVGGLLALSRAFGDAYLKGSLQFEGVRAGGDGYSSGFGVTADPHVTVMEITPEDSWAVVCSDGLFANEERGGGGGLTNQAIMDACNNGGGKSADEIATKLCADAQAAGSTDDVTCVLVKLQ